MLINGEWVNSSNGNSISVINPATLEEIATVPRGSKDDIDTAVKSARQAFESEEWQRFKPYDRGKVLYEIATKLRMEQDYIAQMECLDVGKPISQARADVEAAARYFEYYAGVADKILGETIPIEPGIIDFTLREPVGVTAHIIPWNYPIQISSRSAAAAIATGNAVVMKPAEDTPLTTLILAEIFAETSLPKGIFNVVTGYGSEAGSALSSHPDVDHITFTGSVETGSQVMGAAAKTITPVTLELGGKSPNIVFADCHQTEAIQAIIRSIIQNAGQTCSAGSRLLIERSIKDEFLSKLIHLMNQLTIGPGIEDHDLGPLISEKQLNRIEAYMAIAKEEGGKFLIGGKKAEMKGLAGHYFPPTVIDHIKHSSRIAQEEIFGPVVAVFTFETIEEAIQLANGTEYGLVTGIWTQDINKAHFLATKIRSGQVFINNYGAGGGIQMPFGGSKKSGFGREKGLEALRNYTQLKNIAIKFQG